MIEIAWRRARVGNTWNRELGKPSAGQRTWFSRPTRVTINAPESDKSFYFEVLDSESESDLLDSHLADIGAYTSHLRDLEVTVFHKFLYFK